MISSLETRSFHSIAVRAGPIPDLLAEPRVLDVCVNPDGKLWVNRLGSGFTQEGTFTGSDSALLLSGIATVRDLDLNEKTPVLETIFPLTGDRIEGLMPLSSRLQRLPSALGKRSFMSCATWKSCGS
jgi:type IV secretion system protein TrbB